jgi:putative SOS response-associated peptidase YedK
MCYDIKTMRESQLKKARHYGDVEQIERLKKEIEQLRLYEFHHVSGFDHPQLPIIVNTPEKFKIATWGFIPDWIKDWESGKQFYHQTLNARRETIFEKNTYKTAISQQRCLIVVDGFYEHHHAFKKTYPYFIFMKTNEPMLLAGVWNVWKDKTNNQEVATFSIVTTKGNDLMKNIHNNPKMEEARMPVILPTELSELWLTMDATDKAGQDAVIALCQPYESEKMDAYTVKPIRGKNVSSNIPEASMPFIYPELNNNKQLELF